MKIYIASKVYHSQKWRALREQGVPIIASWIDYDESDVFDEEGKRKLWDACATEPAEADITIVYASPGDVLKGALIECGVALGAGRHVIQVGTCQSLQAGDRSDASFSKHARWLTAASMEEALALARQLAP